MQLAQPYTQKPPLGAQLNRSHPLAQGLVGCWLLSENGGNRALSATGANNGTLLDGPTWVASGLNFVRGSDASATKNRVECGNAVVPTYADSYTMIASFTPVIPGSGSECVVMGQCPTTGSVFQPSMGIGFNATNGRLRAYFASASVNSLLGATTSGLTINMAAVFTGGTNAAIYKNGIFVRNDTISGAANMAGKFLLGAHYRQAAGVYYAGMNGTIHWSMLYNRALSAAEIASLHTNPYQIFSRYMWLPVTVGGGGPTTWELHANVDGTWKRIGLTDASVNIDGNWKTVNGVAMRVDSAWKDIITS